MIVALAFTLGIDRLQAQATYTWTGGGNTTKITNPGNWLSGSVPVGLGGLIENVSLTAPTAQTVTIDGFTLHDLTFGGTAASTYTIGGIGPFTLTGDVTASVANISIGSTVGLILRSDGTDNVHTVNAASGVTVSVLSPVSESASSASFVKSGAGTLILGGANTFSGTTTINGGILAISADNNLGAAPTSFSAGKLTLNGGTLEATTGFTLNSFRGLALGSSGGSLQVDTGTLSYAGNISGSGGLAKTGVGTLTLSGANTYTGGTTVSGGSLILTNASGSATGTGDVTVSASGILAIGNGGSTGGLVGNVINSGSVIYNRSDNATYGGVLSGSGAFTKQGSGVLTLTGAHTFSGNTTISAGTLLLGVSNALPTTTLVAITGNATLDVAANQTITGFFNSNLSSLIQLETGNTLKVTLGTAIFGTSFGGVIAGAGIFSVGPSTDAGIGHTVALTGSNTYTGGTVIDFDGKLLLGNNGTTGSITGNVLDDGLLIFNRGNTMTFSGVITGKGSVSQGLSSGGTSGRTILTAANTYFGGTTIFGGTLLVNNTTGSGTGTGSVAVSKSTATPLTQSTAGNIVTPALGGTGIITGNVTVFPAGVITPGGDGAVGNLTVGSTTFMGGSGFAFDFGATVGTPGANWDLLTITGQLFFDASTSVNPIFLNPNPVSPIIPTTLDLTQSYSWLFISATGGITNFSPSAFTFKNDTGNFGIFSVGQVGNSLFLNFSPAAIPEPSTWALLATGLGALAFTALRRRRR